MQEMSSKDASLLHASELFDGHCRQISDEDSALLASEDVQHHLKNWALIGSALRNEMPAQIDLNFSDKVMSKIASDNELPSFLANRANFAAASSMTLSQVALNDQSDIANKSTAEVKVKASHKLNLFNARSMFTYAAQVAVAASVAVVSVIGIQTYNASEAELDNVSTSATINNTAIGGVSLASYQNADNAISFSANLSKEQIDLAHVTPETAAQIQNERAQEMAKINRYVQAYVFDTTTNKR